MRLIIRLPVLFLAALGCGSAGPTENPACQASPASYHTYETAAELEGLLIGRWQRCIAPQVPGEDVGVEFTADGHWYPLTHAPDGAAIRRTGVDYGGQWKYIPSGSTNPISGQTAARAEFLIDEVTTSPPRFTDDPRQLRITFSPVLSIYLPLP
jgi:hypothetical protein